jgi:hypothetical protein
MTQLSGGGALERLDQLRRRVTEAQRRPAEIEAERRAAVRAVEQAHAGLRRFYAAGGESGSPQEAEHLGALERAEQAAAARWDDRREGANLAIREATQERRVFIVEHFDEIAAGLAVQARRAHVELLAARQRLSAARQEHERVLDEWWPLLHDVGIDQGDLPRPGSHEPPMPRSLRPLLDEMHDGEPLEEAA